MKQIRRLLTIVFLCLLPLTLGAQTYKELWNEVDGFAKKDLPKSQIKVLDKLIVKAEKEKDYGQLLSGELVKYSISRVLSPDSVRNIQKRFRNKAVANQKKNPGLSAIYYCVLNDPDNALNNMEALSKIKDNSYSPLVEIGVNSDIFNHDLLHVIAIYLNKNKKVADFYRKKGNRKAAFVLEGLDKLGWRADLKGIDSLIAANSDLEEAVWMAAKRASATYNYIDRGEYADSILAAHPKNVYGNLLRNIILDASYPKTSISLDNSLNTSSDSIKFKISSRNVNHLRLQVRPYINDSVVGKKVLMEKELLFKVDSKYKELDTLEALPPLSVGKYELSAIADDYQEDIATCDILVSDLYLIMQPLMNKQVRAAVVNSVTGAPVPFAKFREYDDKKKKLVETFSCDAKGECLISNIDDKNSHFSPVLGNDTISPARYFSLRYSANYQDDKLQCRLMLDRSIYRPGQTMHAAATVYSADKKQSMKVVKGMKLGFMIEEADTVLIAETDEYGTASIDFTIPKDADTGDWSLEVTNDPDEYLKNYNGKDVDDTFEEDVSFRVEEYKRPTFSVKWVPTKQLYHDGDTITLQGKVENLIGVPIQNARVIVSGKTLNDTLVTNEKGIFETKLDLPKLQNKRHFTNLRLNARVTDLSGETREDDIYIPISTKSVILMLFWKKTRLSIPYLPTLEGRI